MFVMKKSRLFSINVALFSVVILSFLFGCSKKDVVADDVIGSDNIIVFQLNFGTFLDNADCKYEKDGIEFSPAVEKLFGGVLLRDRNDLEKISKISGVDIKNVMIGIGNEYVVVTAPLTNKGDFCKWLESNITDDIKPVQENGYDIYSLDDDACAFINENSVCFVASENDTKVNLESFNTIKENAVEHALSKWQKDALQKGNSCNMLININALNEKAQKGGGYSMFDNPMLSMAYKKEVLEDSYVISNFDLKGLKLCAETTIVNSEGKKVENEFSNEEVNVNLLKYANRNAQSVIMMAVPDTINWADYMKEISTTVNAGISQSDIQSISKYLDYVDGTIMVSVGVDLGKLAMGTSQPFNFTAAAEIEKGKGKELLDNIYEAINEEKSSQKDLGINNDFPKIKTDDLGLVVSFDANNNISFRLEDNVMIVSNESSSVSGASPFDEAVFKGKNFGWTITLSPALFSSFGFKLPFAMDFIIYSEDNKSVMKVEMTETDGNLLANIFSFIAGQVR